MEDILLKFWKAVYKRNYNSLNAEESNNIRELYKSSIMGINNLETRLKNSRLINNFTRIVIGDHGIYVEFKKEYLNTEIYVPEKQKYRLEEKWKSQVAYIWYETLIGGCKVYEQLKIVKYADYKVGMFYISIWDVLAFSFNEITKTIDV